MSQLVVWITVLIVLGLVAAIVVGMLRIPQATLKTYPADKGQNYVDVSGYPPQMQEYYQLFANKCSRCHTLARPINSTFTDKEWKKYVRQMMRKPGSGLTPKTASQITEFLVYDAQIRER